MSTALFAISRVLTPLQGLRRWLAPNATIKPTPAFRNQPLQEAAGPSMCKPLRIVRILEADQAPTHVGRMVISGRMADVCAELDRLAAMH